MDYKLYSYYRSSCSWRVRIALAFKGLQSAIEPIHLVRDGGEQHFAEYRAHNPMGQLPALETGASTLAQSVAILEYLEEVHPSPALLPQGAAQRAKVREMVQIINSGIQPIQNLSVMQELASRFGLAREDTVAWSHHWIDRGFHALEAVCASHAGEYLMGDDVTMADVCLVPQVYNANRFKVDMNQFPTLLRVHEGLQALPPFHDTRPEGQPDAPSDV